MLNNIRAYLLLIGFICFCHYKLPAQDKEIADSLRTVYKKGNLNGLDKLYLLHELAFYSTDSLLESVTYADELIRLAKADSNYLYVYRGYSQLGQTYRIAGDMTEALDAFFKASEVAQNLSDKRYLGGGYLTIADTYSELENNDNAENYYKKSIEILRITEDTLTLASALLNSGYHNYLTDKFDQALGHYNESSIIFEQMDYAIGSAYNIGNIGMVYAKQGRDEQAMDRINEAVEILEKYEDYYAISEYLTSMSDVYVGQGKISKALEYDHRSLDLARKYKLKKQISESNASLADLYEKLGNAEASLFHYKEHILYRDSIKNLEDIEDIADMRTDFEVAQEQAKTTISEQKRKNQRIVIWSTVGVLFLTSLLAYGLFKRNKFVRATNKIIADEKERSDNLLLNILPEDTALELKEKGSVDAKKYPSVTVLFTDFKGFTKYAEGLSPEELVKTIDYYFTEFDLIMERHGLEKIKTIGDAYMAVGGLSLDNVDQAEDMIKAAKEMNDFVVKAKEDVHTSATFDIRIGINTGPVVAGVVGKKKFAYDIWGDTVNVAARMESSSEPGRINISEFTYNRINSVFDCTYRGELEVKNRGKLKMYFVNT